MKLRHSEECADARQRPAREDKGAPPCREVGERSRGSAGTRRRLLEAARPAALITALHVYDAMRGVGEFPPMPPSEFTI